MRVFGERLVSGYRIIAFPSLLRILYTMYATLDDALVSLK
jgi:hypothetical protein